MHDVAQLRDLALAIARDVAHIPADAQPRTHAVRRLATATKSSETDIVTELDSATERAVFDRIRAARPDDAILGEEGASVAGTSGYTWVVDPIDGTVNYFFGSPVWAICIGVIDASGDAVVGVVHAPALRETYVAAKGCGAVLLQDGATYALTPPPEAEFGMALLATGFSYDRERRQAMARVAAAFIPRIRDLRRGGAASLDICGVAAGRLNGYYERDLKPWDRAAAFAVAGELGLTRWVTGDPMGANLTIVAPPLLAEHLRSELAALGVHD